MFSAKFNLIKNRVWVPANLKRIIGNGFFKFGIFQNGQKISFISKLNKDGRLVIPKEYGSLKTGSVTVSYSPIINCSRTKHTFVGSKIDLLSTIPTNTLSGFEILVSKKRGKLFVWYFSSKGRPDPIIIKRYVDSEFSRFLGYYRAEGGKSRVSRRRGREFSFTNKSLPIIQDFIKIFGSFSDTKMLKSRIAYNPTFNDIPKVKRQLIDMGVDKNSITVGKSGNVKEFVIRLYVTNSLLSEIVNNSESLFRTHIHNSKNEAHLVEYLRGVIAGDGCLYSYRDKKGSLHSKLNIFEPNRHALECIQNLLSSLGIHGDIDRKNEKMYTYTAYLNWGGLLIMYEKALSPFKVNVLKNTIKSHKRFRSLKYLIYLPRKFNTSQFRTITERSYDYSISWLKRREKENLIKRAVKDTKKRNVWILRESAISTARLLKEIVRSA